MIVEKLENKEAFTNSEKLIAEYILKNPFDLIHLSASELGALTYTSKASVFRLCKKLGVESYELFKHEIELEMNEKTRLEQLLHQEPFHEQSSLKEIINILPSFYDTAINNTRINLNQEVINRVVQHLYLADKIDIYATGITSSCASAAMFKFLSIGKECSVQSSINEHYVMANRGKRTVSILLSFTGNNPSMIQIAAYLKSLNMYTVGIGGVEGRELKDICQEYIQNYQKNLVLSLEVLTPYISITYILDILFAAMLVNRYQGCLTDAIDILKQKEVSS